MSAASDGYEYEKAGVRVPSLQVYHSSVSVSLKKSRWLVLSDREQPGKTETRLKPGDRYRTVLPSWKNGLVMIMIMVVISSLWCGRLCRMLKIDQVTQGTQSASCPWLEARRCELVDEQCLCCGMLGMLLGRYHRVHCAGDADTAALSQLLPYTPIAVVELLPHRDLPANEHL